MKAKQCLECGTMFTHETDTDFCNFCRPAVREFTKGVYDIRDMTVEQLENDIEVLEAELLDLDSDSDEYYDICIFIGHYQDELKSRLS